MDAGPLKMKNNATPHETPSLPLPLPSEVLETATLTTLNYLTKCTIVFLLHIYFFYISSNCSIVHVSVEESSQIAVIMMFRTTNKRFFFLL